MNNLNNLLNKFKIQNLMQPLRQNYQLVAIDKVIDETFGKLASVRNVRNIYLNTNKIIARYKSEKETLNDSAT